jgi:hypothetical protein
MEASILTSTKKILGIAEAYTAFDLDIITHINATVSILAQLGVGPSEGFMIEDELNEWDEFDVPQAQSNLVKTYIFLKVRLLFDPPATSYLITATENQIKEYEWRLNLARESEIPLPIEDVVEEGVVW